MIQPVTLAEADRARYVLDSAVGISVRDAVHAAVMLHNGVDASATYDDGSTSSRAPAALPLL